MGSGNTLAIQLTVGADGLVEGLKVAGKNVDGAAQQMRAAFKDVGHAANEATAPVDEFVHHIRGMRQEAFLGNFMAKQLEEVGLASKAAAGQITNLVSAFALGGGLGVGIEVVKMVAIAFKESGEEIKQANEKAEESVKKLKEQTDLLILSIKGASEAEKLRHTNIVPLEKQELAQKQELYRAYAQLFEAEEKLANMKKEGMNVSADELPEIARAKTRVDQAKTLLDITRKQRKEEEEAIEGVESAQGGKDAKEQRAHDDAEAMKLYMQSLKDNEALEQEIYQRTLARLKDEEAARGRVIEAEYTVSAAGRKLAEDNDKAREDRAKRLSAYEGELAKKIALDWMHSANAIGQSMGATFAGLVSGTTTVGESFKAMAGEIVKAVVSAAIKSLEAYAVSAEGAAFFSQAGIPVIGPILAVASAASAGAFVEGLIGSLPSAAVGMPYVQRDGPVYLHEGERVLTKHENETYDGGGGAGALHVTIHAMDGASVQRVVESQAFVRAINEARRNGVLT